MKIPSTSSAAVLQELAAWCQLAHDVFHSSQHTLETRTVRNLKQRLLRYHARHLVQLREWLGRRRTVGRLARKPPDALAEVMTAMSSRNEYVAFAACALLERAVLVAYERAADHTRLENTAMHLVHRQQLALKCCHHRYFHRLRRWGEFSARTAENRPAFGELAAAAS